MWPTKGPAGDFYLSSRLLADLGSGQPKKNKIKPSISRPEAEKVIVIFSGPAEGVLLATKNKSTRFKVKVRSCEI